MNEFTIEDAKEMVKAWESLPGGRNYSPQRISKWLQDDMAPIINKFRQKIKETENIKSNNDD